MRTRYYKNSLYSIANYFLLIFLNLSVRKALVEQFSIEYTGYEALFTDIFALLSIADFGIDSIITYKLYEILDTNRNQIPRIMDLAKKFYRLVSALILTIGGVFFLIIPTVFHKDTYDISLIKYIYIIQIFNLCISYITGYKRLLFVADQKEYICLRWDSFVMIIVQLSRIFILGYWKNYYLYMFMCIIQTLGQNIGINIKYNKEFKSVSDMHYDKINIMAISKDIRNLLAHKISSLVYSATDNIIITATLGLATAGLYSNYYMLSKYTYTFATKIMKPMQATIGHYLYSNIEKISKYKLLSKLNELTFIFASFICISLIQLSTPFIRIWLGNEYIQENSLVILLAINFFIAINQDVIYYFRNSFGEYDYDKRYMILSAVFNFILSIVLSRFWGLNGIVCATIIGHLFIWYGRVKFVYIHYFKFGFKKYWLDQFQKVGLLCIQIMLCKHFIKDTWLGIIGGIRREMYVVVILAITFAVVKSLKILCKKMQK